MTISRQNHSSNMVCSKHITE